MWKRLLRRARAGEAASPYATLVLLLRELLAVPAKVRGAKTAHPVKAAKSTARKAAAALPIPPSIPTPAELVAPKALGALKFLYWCFMHGDQLTNGTGFAPLPVSVQAKLVARLGAVAPRQGARPSYQQY